MSFGTTKSTIAAARVQIFRGAQEVTLTSDVAVHVTRIIDRINTRAGPVDTPRWKLEEIEFTALLTEALQAQAQTDMGISDASDLSYTSWTVKGLSKNGTAGDNVDDDYDCTLIEYHDIGPENNAAQIRIRLRVEGTTD